MIPLLASCPPGDVAARQTPTGAAPKNDGVLLNATELFVSREIHSERDVTVFRELALNLLPQADDDTRRKIACHLTRYPHSPIEVLKVLGRDADPLTAYPVLRNTPGLGEDILLLQAERGPDSLRKAIAERADLTQAVALVLARTAAAPVIEELLARDTITLSEEMVACLCQRPETLQAFGDLLITRKALTGEHLLKHFPRLGKGLRQEAIASAELANLVQLARSGSYRAARPVFKKEVLKRIAETALMEGPEAFSEALAYALGLPGELTRRAVDMDSGETLAIGLKALGFDQRMASGILIRLLGDRLSLETLRDLIDLFVSVSHGAALVLIKHWSDVPGQRTAPAQANVRHMPLVQEAPRLRHTGEPVARASHGIDDGSSSPEPWQEIEEIEKILRFSR